MEKEDLQMSTKPEPPIDQARKLESWPSTSQQSGKVFTALPPEKVVMKVNDLSPGENALIHAINDNSKALIGQGKEVVRLLSEMQLTQRNFLDQMLQGRSAPGIRPRENYGKPPETPGEKKIVTCGTKNFDGCGAPIYWKDRKPLNPDGSPHHCQR